MSKGTELGIKMFKLIDSLTDTVIELQGTAKYLADTGGDYVIARKLLDTSSALMVKQAELRDTYVEALQNDVEVIRSITDDIESL